MLRWLLRVLLVLLLLLVGGTLAMVRRDRPPAEVEARWATPPSQFVAAAGLRVHVRERGSGPALVLLHGMGSSLFTREGWARELATDRRVIALDLPGHGLTGPRPDDRYSPGDMAEVVDAVVSALGVTRFSLAGNSMGGQVAIAYTLAHPERVDRLILVDPYVLPREEPLPFAFRLFAMPVVGDIVTHVTPRFVIEKSLHDVYGDPAKVTEENIDRTYDLVLREGNRRAVHIRLAMPQDAALPTHLGELHLPVLIMWGSRDTWILPKYGARLRDAIAGAKLVMLDGLGHVPMEEDPVTTAKLAREFLKP
jgi:pimeloyl-ACP methyl ester carboxylesterase